MVFYRISTEHKLKGATMTENQERAYEELTKFQSLQSEIRILELKLFISIQAESLKECT